MESIRSALSETFGSLTGGSEILKVPASELVACANPWTIRHRCVQSSRKYVAARRADESVPPWERLDGYAGSGQTTSYGGLTLTYMNSGRLSSVNQGGTATTYLTNALGQRIEKSGASVTLFVYDESGHLLGEYDGAGHLIEETIWMGDVPVAVLQPSGTGVATYYVHTDHLNTPRRISRPADNVIVWRWDSEPFGFALPNQDPDGDGQMFVYNLRYPGQYYDVEMGINHNYFRDYDPGTGRYVESDPIGIFAGVNTYAYVHGSPASFADSIGLLDNTSPWQLGWE